jgi:MraZ protein
MLSGQYEYSLDDKGRLSIPAKFRDSFLSGPSPVLVVAKAPDGYLAAYPMNEWQALQDRVEGMDLEKKRAARNHIRLFYASAVECSIDRLGRILLPQSLRSYGSIKKSVMIVGMHKWMEIWAAEVWTELEKSAASDKEGTTEAAILLGF